MVPMLVHGATVQGLLDTGANYNILAASCFRAMPEKYQVLARPSNLRCYTATGQPVDLLGKTRIQFSLGKYEFDDEFLVADVQRNILGNPFFRKYDAALHYLEGVVVLSINTDLKRRAIYQICFDERRFTLLKVFRPNTAYM